MDIVVRKDFEPTNTYRIAKNILIKQEEINTSIERDAYAAGSAE